MGNSVTRIGDSAFEDCTGLTAVTIPDSVSSIGYGAFQGCIGLQAIYFLGNAPGLGASAFTGASGSTVYFMGGATGWGATLGGRPTVDQQYAYTIAYGQITITGYTGPDSALILPTTLNGLPVTFIGDSAFKGLTGLTRVTIPASVTRIEDSAFEGCTGLTGVTIPASVTRIGDSVFHGCIGLKGVYFLGSAPSLGASVFTGATDATVYFKGGVTGWDPTFGGRPAVGQWMLTYTAGSHGSTIGTTPQTVDHGANSSAVTAVPDTGYAFTRWSDAVTNNPRSDLNVTAGITVTAEYNAIPVAVADGISRNDSTRVTKVLLATLRANDTDLENDTLSITAVGSALPAGATVSISGAFVVYVVPSNTAGNGSFTYTLSDASSSVTGTVTVTETSSSAAAGSPNSASLVRSGSDYVLKFLGVPGRTYGVQYTAATGEPYTWREFPTPVVLVAPDSGVMSHTDGNPPGPIRLYRAVLLQ